MSIQKNVYKESHVISGVAMAGDAVDGANVHHITDAGSSRNNNQIVENSSNVGTSRINANAKWRIAKNPIQIRKHKKNAHEDAILTRTVHLAGNGGAGLRNKRRCNSHNANHNVQIGTSVICQNNVQSHANHHAMSAQEDATVAIVFHQVVGGVFGHKDECKFNKCKKISAQIGGQLKEEKEVAWLQINLHAENVRELGITTTIVHHSGGGGSGHKNKGKCSNNNGQIPVVAKCNHNGHNDITRHAENGREDVNLIKEFGHSGFGGLEQKDKDKWGEDG